MALFTNKSNKLQSPIQEYFQNIQQIFLGSPEKCLNQAYRAALTIKSIEDEYFDGHKISAESAQYSNSVMLLLQAELDKNINIAKKKLAQLKASQSFISISNYICLEKIRFIDEVIDKYSVLETTSISLVSNPEPKSTLLTQTNNQLSLPSEDINNFEFQTQKMSPLPRSIGRTINRIKLELKPQAEREVIKDFRSSSVKTKTAVTFLLSLIIIPILIQHLSKQFIISPIIHQVRGEHSTEVFLHEEMKEKAFGELKLFEEELRFASLIDNSPRLSQEAIEEKVKHKASEMLEEFREKSTGAISNVFADILAVITFIILLVTQKKQFIVFKSFLDDTIYGLSDSAKAFIIILSTDMFVGFHSSHGWEVILEGMADHLGVAANQSAIYLFIATFPVILDTIFKYWIFRYLSRISPSALATLRHMNE
ncbi:MAG: proton extrusion protein PcxA [Nostoc sp. ChiSLP02]|nr:proton extrusion protein PcxA [Nostoc sp. DedSLP05]MDZ8100241.1 proton extrusion protein PcxA [Nostoc sp. DedSLP01]MDZ8184001.1 proton extrusion protein PcxA [Nostoc sp. ChiSLP02]